MAAEKMASVVAPSAGIKLGSGEFLYKTVRLPAFIKLTGAELLFSNSVSFRRTDRVEQPGPCICPISFGGGQRDIHRGSRLLQRQTCEIAELNQLRLFRRLGGEIGQRFI